MPLFFPEHQEDDGVGHAISLEMCFGFCWGYACCAVLSWRTEQGAILAPFGQSVEFHYTKWTACATIFFCFSVCVVDVQPDEGL